MGNINTKGKKSGGKNVGSIFKLTAISTVSSNLRLEESFIKSIPSSRR